MLKTNTVGRKLYFSVLAVFLVFAVSFIVFQQTREKQYKISTLTLKLANYNELLVEDLALSSSNGILLSDTVNLVDSVRVAEAKLEDFVQEHESKDLRVTLIKPDGKVIYDNMRKDFRKFPIMQKSGDCGGTSGWNGNQCRTPVFYPQARLFLCSILFS